MAGRIASATVLWFVDCPIPVQFPHSIFAETKMGLIVNTIDDKDLSFSRNKITGLQLTLTAKG
jgi:hypothetical protein